MSLVVWYPFTKDLKNKGLSDITETLGSGVSLVNSNQFGTCASFDNSTNGYILLNNFPSNEAFGKTNWSIAFWINFKRDGDRGFILCSYANGTQNINIEINGNSHTDNALRLYWYTGTNNLNYSSTLLIDANKWIHVCITYDGTDAKFYKNGELVDTKIASLTYSEITNNWYFGNDNRLNNRLYGELHDFRVYNHRLSTKEIKELSKGLILHHALKGYGAGENILPETPLNGQNPTFDESFDRYVYIRDITKTTEDYIYTGRTEPVEQSTQYTFSCYLWLNDNVKNVEFFWLSDTEENQKTGVSWVNVTSTNSTGDTTSINNALVRNKWNYVTWTFTTKANDYTGFIRYDNNGSKIEGEHAIIKACCPKLEKGSKATPFLPYKAPLEIKNLPSAYTQLEYIEGTGTQYINTGYVHKATTRIDIVCELKEAISSNYKALFGTRNGSYRDNSFNLFTIYGYKAIPMFSRSGNEKSGTGLLYNEKILISAYDKTCSWYRYGSTTAYGSVTTTGTADAGFNKMLLFDLNVSTTADGVTPGHGGNFCKIYSCKIWDDNGTTLVRDFIPAMRKSDKKIGLYDAVNDTFYTNASTGEFLTSPDIIEEDLSGNGFNGTRQGVTFTPDSPRYYMSTEFDANKDLILDRIFHQGDEVSNLSVSIWFKFNSVGGNIWNLNINQFWRIRPISNSTLQGLVYMNNGTQDVRFSIGKSLNTNSWFHFVTTFDKGIFKLYVDGILVDTVDKSDIATTIKCTSNTPRWSLGDINPGQEIMNGKLSDFRIYAKTLTADEVTELYKVSAQVDKTGKLYCGELVEE